MPIDYNASDASTCWPDGDYEASLEKVEDSTSKKTGNPMQVWTFRAFDANGRSQLVTEYVVVPATTFKIKQLADALGCRAQFDAGTFQADDHIDEKVVLNLIVESQEGFDDKNRVQRIKPAGTTGGRTPTPKGKPQPARPQRQTAPAGAAAKGSGGARAEQSFDETFPEGDFPPKRDEIPFRHRQPGRGL